MFSTLVAPPAAVAGARRAISPLAGSAAVIWLPEAATGVPSRAAVRLSRDGPTTDPLADSAGPPTLAAAARPALVCPASEALRTAAIAAAAASTLRAA